MEVIGFFNSCATKETNSLLASFARWTSPYSCAFEMAMAAQVAAAVGRGTQVVLATHHPEDVPTYVTRCLTLPARRAASKRR